MSVRDSRRWTLPSSWVTMRLPDNRVITWPSEKWSGLVAVVCSEPFSSEAPPRERTSPRARTRARSAQVKGTPSSSFSVYGFRRNRIKSRPCCEGTSCKEDGRGRTARLLQSVMIASSTRPRGCARSGGGRARCLRRGPGIERRRGLVVGDGLRAYERLRVLMDAACGVNKIVS